MTRAILEYSPEKSTLWEMPEFIFDAFNRGLRYGWKNVETFVELMPVELRIMVKATDVPNEKINPVNLPSVIFVEYAFNSTPAPESSPPSNQSLGL